MACPQTKSLRAEWSLARETTISPACHYSVGSCEALRASSIEHPCTCAQEGGDACTSAHMYSQITRSTPRTLLRILPQARPYQSCTRSTPRTLLRILPQACPYQYSPACDYSVGSCEEHPCTCTQEGGDACTSKHMYSQNHVVITLMGSSNMLTAPE